MSRHQSIIARVASCVAMGIIVVAGLGGCASDRTGPGAPPIQVVVSVDASGMPWASPDSFTAHEGDTVHWVFRGTPAKDFAVLFTSVADSPFDWKAQTGASVWGTVKAGAAKGGKETPYKYSVDVDGKVRDPMIIIEPKH